MAFWLAVGVGCLCLLDIAASPLLAAGFAAVFFTAAWGIRRGQSWAAVTGAYLMLMPLLMQSVRWDRDWRALAIAGPICLAVAAVMLRGAQRLGPAGPRGPAWPWLPVIVLLIPVTLFFRPMVIPTEAMADTLQRGDRLVVESASAILGLSSKRGEVVVFRYPADRRQIFIKRVVAVPGDRLRIQGKQLFRNGLPVQEPFATHKRDEIDPFRDNFPATPHFQLAASGLEMLDRYVRGGEVVVPEGRYFVLGDNRDNSLDSRYWGFVPRRDILGRPLFLYATGQPGKKARWTRLRAIP